MAAGQCTLTNHGSYAVSGATLKTVVDGITNVNFGISGNALYLIPTANGTQVQVIQVAVAKS